MKINSTRVVKVYIISLTIIGSLHNPIQGILGAENFEITSSNPINQLTLEEQSSEYQRIIEFFLSDSIYDSLDRIYGKDQGGYWKLEFLDIKRIIDEEAFQGVYGSYRFTVTFETYKGAHNPPYDKNIAVYEMTDTRPMQIREISFKHYPIDYLSMY